MSFGKEITNFCFCISLLLSWTFKFLKPLMTLENVKSGNFLALKLIWKDLKWTYLMI